MSGRYISGEWDVRAFRCRFLILSNDVVIGIFRNIANLSNDFFQQTEDFDISMNEAIYNSIYFIFSADAEYVYISDGGVTQTSLTRFAPSKYYRQVRTV